jgi:hypothetical protein
VPTSGRRGLGVRISQDVWVVEVERLSARSQARVAAERERPRLERDGVELAQLLACSDLGADGTRLRGLYKVYVRSAMLRHPRGPSGSCSRWPSETARCTCGSSPSGRGIRREERGACTTGRTSACTVGIPTSDGSPTATDELGLHADLEPGCRAQVAHAVGHVGLIGAPRRITGNGTGARPNMTGIHRTSASTERSS